MLRNLFAGHHSPVPFALNDLTALLPSDESDFAFGVIPRIRAALPTSQAAIDHPELVNCSSRSLFGAVIQGYKFWGQIARGACLDGGGPKIGDVQLWDNASPYSQQSMALLEWEAGLSKEHTWTEWNLRVYKAQNLDIAYTSIFLAIRLCNIVLRRTYLAEIKAGILSRDTHILFWENMSEELFSNVLSLHQGIAVYLANRPLTEGFPPLLAFSAYLCGSLATQLWRCPQLCPRLAHRSESIVDRSKKDLLQICSAWPIAAHWHKALELASAELPSLNAVDMPESQRFDQAFMVRTVPAILMHNTYPCTVPRYYISRE